jgi:hypothetical protein
MNSSGCVMKRVFAIAWLSLAGTGLSACGGGGDDTRVASVNTDYSALDVAESVDAPLVPASDQTALLEALRNGLRLSLDSARSAVIYAAAAGGAGQQYSGTTLQVEGVDEPDLMKYDGQYVYALDSPSGPVSRGNVLRIYRTDANAATYERMSEFTFDTDLYRVGRPLLYTVPNDSGTTRYVAAVTLNSRSDVFPVDFAPGPAMPPWWTGVRLIDVSDPAHPANAWKLELEGTLQASRKIGNMLYVVTTHWPRLPGLVRPADTEDTRQGNERQIRAATADALLPHARENDGPALVTPRPGDCFTIANVGANDAFTALVTITAIDLERRRIADVACLNTNVLGVYVSQNTLYVGGHGGRASYTVLHKFALDGGSIVYRATGAVPGIIGWRNGSYMMDEHEGDLRIVTSQGDSHRLSVLREAERNRLVTLAALPNERRPERIGKPGEQVQAVRFAGTRAYVVTFRRTDPLYALDLSDPSDPRVAGALEIPGFSTYLAPIGEPASQLLLSVGQAADTSGLNQGVKVELFDVRDLSRPRSLGAYEFGARGSYSEAVDDPHALATVRLSDGRYRIAVPGTILAEVNIQIFPEPPRSSYSGLHLLEITGQSASPQLNLRGVIKTDERTGGLAKSSIGMRGILHGDSVFVVQGEQVVGRRWDELK